MKHSRYPVIRRPPPEWEPTSAGLVLSDPHGSLLRSASKTSGPSPTLQSPEECPTSRLCSTDESVTFPDPCRSDNALSFHGLLFPSKVLRGPQPRRRGRLLRPRGSETRHGDTNVTAPRDRPLGLPYEPSLPRFTDATSCTSTEIEQVSRESVRTRSRETCVDPPPGSPDRSRARPLDSPPAPHRPSWGL
jgi:hypothetical protein